MRVGEYVLINHGRYRWKTGRIISQPAILTEYGLKRKSRAVGRKWLIELSDGPRVEVREYELEITSSID